MPRVPYGLCTLEESWLYLLVNLLDSYGFVSDGMVDLSPDRDSSTESNISLNDSKESSYIV